MLVEKYKGTAEATEGFASHSRTYSVDSPALVFDVLCNKMYTHPLSTMVQEYLANARDAHREANNTQTPVKVSLPNELDPHLYIRDFGPGLTDERIDNVFVKLGASTKSDSDEMTGGFGLGAKIGWAYGDSFSVISVVDGVQSTYLAYLGEDGVGRMDTLNVDTVNEPNGVTIKIFIQPHDRSDLVDIIEKITYFWEVPPACETHVFQNYGQSINSMVLYISTPFSHHGSIYAVVDGIPYDIEKHHVPKTSSLRMPGNKSALFLFFDVGEVDVAINREGLRYSVKTIENITHSVQSVADMNAESAKTAAEMHNFHEKVKALRECYTLIGAPQDVVVPVLPLLFLSFSYYHSSGRLVVMRTVGSTASLYAVSKTNKVRDDIYIRQSSYADSVRDSYLTGGTYKISSISGMAIPLNKDSHDAPDYVCLISDEDFSTKYRARCRTAVNAKGQYASVKILVLDNKATYDFLVGELGYATLNYVEETYPEKIKRDNSNRACNFVETDVKDVHSRTRTIHIDDLINHPNAMWCTFKECGEARDFIRRAKSTMKAYNATPCFYLTQPQVQYLNKQPVAPPHYKEAYERSLRAVPMRLYADIEGHLNQAEDELQRMTLLTKHNVFNHATAMRLALNNFDKFPADHIIHKVIKSYAKVWLVECGYMRDRMKDLESYSYLLRNSHDQGCRRYTYYKNLVRSINREHTELLSEFHEEFPLMDAMSGKFHTYGHQGKRIEDHLIKYLNSSCM